jgi:hypothetical protein
LAEFIDFAVPWPVGGVNVKLLPKDGTLADLWCADQEQL